MSEEKIILKAEDVRTYFPVKGALGQTVKEVKAVDGVSLALRQGETYGLVRESGCGKSTLLRLISGLEPPDTGKLLLRGQALPARRSRDQLRAVQLIFQDAAGAFHPRRRIADSIQDSVRSLLGRDSRADIPALCALVGLDPALARRYPRELSGGQCQRFAIARAMARQQTDKIAFLICKEGATILDEFYASICEGVMRRANGTNYQLLISTAEEWTRTAQSKQIEGVILAGNAQADLISEFQRQNIPVVLVNNRAAGFNLPCICLLYTSDAADE